MVLLNPRPSNPGSRFHFLSPAVMIEHTKKGILYRIPLQVYGRSTRRVLSNPHRADLLEGILLKIGK